MSKTFIDQKRYYAKHYYRSNWFTFNLRGDIHLPEPKDIHEPEWWNLGRYYCGNDSAKFWFRISNRKARRKVKSLLRQGMYDDAKYVKPENVDWNIC